MSKEISRAETERLKRDAEQFRRQNIFLAVFGDGSYANAIKFWELVASVKHVVEGYPKFQQAGSEVEHHFNFDKHPYRDLALSSNHITNKLPGFTEIHVPKLGETLLVCGYHESMCKYYEIPVIVTGMDKGRYVVENIGTKPDRQKTNGVWHADDFNKIFEFGVSGWPGLFVGKDRTKNYLVGLLSTKAPGDFDGHAVRIEPATELLLMYYVMKKRLGI